MHRSRVARRFAVALLALLIGYVPIVYQMFAHRETNVLLLDQRAGSPPTTAELLRRNMGGARRESADCLTARLGSLGGRVAGKPPIVSSTGVFPLSTRRPVVDRSAGAHP